MEKHSLKYFNIKNFFGKIQDANYLKMEEPAAVMLENIIMYGKLPLVSLIVPLITAGEIFDNPKDLKNFISRYLKLIGRYKENGEEKRFLRLKQFYLFDKVGVHRRGIVYSTGLSKIYEFIKTGDVKKVIIGSFSYDILKDKEDIK